MTEQDFIDAAEKAGATDVEIREQLFDYSPKIGVAAQCRLDGRLHRAAIRLAPDTPVESAYPVLLDAVLNPQTRWDK